MDEDSAVNDSQGDSLPGRERTPTPFVLSEGHNDTFRETDDSAVELKTGEIVSDQFEVIRPLGRGGMGVVYEVFDRLTRQRLALKTILPSILAKPHAAERFVHEVNIARRLRHPGIVAVYDVRQVGGLLFFTMEYLEGQTLRQILDRYPRLPLGKAVGVIHRVCVTLEYAHHYAVHRDISPENIMILSDATVRLLDFGIAKTLDLQTLSAKELPIGKSFYMSPEQRENAADVDARSDIFSLGVVLFEMLTGELPSGYHRLTQLRPDVPEMLEQVIGYALAPRHQRYPDARQFRKAVEECYRIYKQKEEDPAHIRSAAPTPGKPEQPQAKEPPQAVERARNATEETGSNERSQKAWDEWDRHLEEQYGAPHPGKMAQYLKKWTHKE